MITDVRTGVDGKAESTPAGTTSITAVVVARDRAAVVEVRLSSGTDVGTDVGRGIVVDLASADAALPLGARSAS